MKKKITLINFKDKCKEVSTEMFQELYDMAKTPLQHDPETGKAYYLPEKLPAVKEIIYNGFGKPGLRKDPEEQNLSPTIDRDLVIAKLKEAIQEVE